MEWETPSVREETTDSGGDYKRTLKRRGKEIFGNSNYIVMSVVFIKLVYGDSDLRLMCQS